MSSDEGDGPGTFTFINFKAVAQVAMAAQQHNLQPAACRYLLEVIAGYTNGHPAFPSYDALAHRTGLSVDAVRRYTKALIDQGYLSRTRRAHPHGHGGWGQPEWALGPTCSQVGAGSHLHVGAGSHMPQVEVGTGSHSSGNGFPHASGNRLPQKREESVGSGRGVVQGKDSGKATTAEKRTSEEKGGTRKTYDGAKVRAMADALKAAGFPTKSMQDARERAAVLSSPHSVADITDCLVAMRDATFGDRYDQDHLTPAWAARRTEAFLNRKLARPATTGPIKRGVAALADL